MWQEMALSFQAGNVYIYGVLALGFVAATIVFERLMMLQFVLNLDYAKFLKDLRKMVEAEDYDRAVTLCKRASKTSLPKIAMRAIETVENDPARVRGVLEEEALDFLPKIEARVATLPVFATLMMLLGIVGTMDGLWWAFHSIDILDTAKKQASLATGIAASLHPTTLALIAAMLVLACHHMVRSMALRLVERTQHGVTALANMLAPDVVAAMAPVASGMPQVRESEAKEAVATERASEPREPAGVDDFDDAMVDDIKDEEEII